MGTSCKCPCGQPVDAATSNMNNQITQCEVCSKELLENEPLSCGHSFHHQCLQQYYKVMISDQKLDLYCPNGCKTKLQHHQIKKFTTKEDFEKYDRIVFESYIASNRQNAFCPFPQCSGVYEFVDESTPYIVCMICSKEFCRLCKKKSHRSEECDVRGSKLNSLLIKNAGWKTCPHCNRTVEKIDGCNSVKCLCRKEFCYTCGGISCPHGNCKDSNRSSVNIEL